MRRSPIVNQCDAEENLTRRGPNSGNKKGPVRSLLTAHGCFRRMVTPSCPCALLPLREPLRSSWCLLLDRILHVVNAHAIENRDPQLVATARRRPLIADE